MTTKLPTNAKENKTEHRHTRNLALLVSFLLNVIIAIMQVMDLNTNIELVPHSFLFNLFGIGPFI